MPDIDQKIVDQAVRGISQNPHMYRRGSRLFWQIGRLANVATTLLDGCGWIANWKVYSTATNSSWFGRGAQQVVGDVLTPWGGKANAWLKDLGAVYLFTNLIGRSSENWNWACNEIREHGRWGAWSVGKAVVKSTANASWALARTTLGAFGSWGPAHPNHSSDWSGVPDSFGNPCPSGTPNFMESGPHMFVTKDIVTNGVDLLPGEYGEDRNRLNRTRRRNLRRNQRRRRAIADRTAELGLALRENGHDPAAAEALVNYYKSFYLKPEGSVSSEISYIFDWVFYCISKVTSLASIVAGITYLAVSFCSAPAWLGILAIILGFIAGVTAVCSLVQEVSAMQNAYKTGLVLNDFAVQVGAAVANRIRQGNPQGAIALLVGLSPDLQGLNEAFQHQQAHAGQPDRHLPQANAMLHRLNHNNPDFEGFVISLCDTIIPREFVNDVLPEEARDPRAADDVV